MKREVKAYITIDKTLFPRMQRKVAIYEALAAMFQFMIAHEQLEDIAENICDVLDQLESANDNGI